MSRKKRTRQKKVERGSTSDVAVPRNWILWLILGVTFFAFSNSLLNGFAYDDTTQILSNQFIRDLENLPKALVTETWYFRAQQDQDPNEQDKPSTPYYRPVFVIYLMVMWKLFGASAPGWHVFNVLLHMLAVYYVFRVLEKVTSDLRLAAIASVLFAVHPLRVESVAWVSGLTDPLLALFLLASFYSYIRYRHEKRPKLLAASLALFVFTAFEKEPAVVFPVFIAAYELFIINQDRDFRSRIKPAMAYGAGFLFISAFYFVARYYALGFALNNPDFKSYPFSQVVLTIPLVIWKYIGLLIWPVDLSLFHATYMVKSPLDLRFILSFAGLVGLAAALWPLRKNMIARFGILWFAINLLPVLNLSAFGEDFLVQECYVYISSIGFSLLVAMALVKVPIEKWLRLEKRRTAQAVLVSVLVFLLAGRSVAQNTTWKDDLTVWLHGVETAPEQSISHYILGHKFISRAEYQKAAEQLEEVLKSSPNNLVATTNLASAYSLIYQYRATANPDTADPAPLTRAIELCQKGLSISDKLSSLWDTMGMIYTFNTNQKNLDRAVACFERGLSLDGENAGIKFHLGATLVKKADFDSGIRYLQAALQVNAGFIDAHKFLAYAYKGKGQLKEAIDEFSVYLQLQPNAPDGVKVSKEVQDLRAQLQTASPQS